MKCCENQGKVIGALLVGAIVGGALGILFAPNTGVETRKKIADKSGDLTDSIQEKLNNFLEDIKEEVQAVSGRASSFLGRTKAIAEKL